MLTMKFVYMCVYMQANEKLDLILAYLRNQYHYCFWCGCDYNSAEELLRECPGTNEDDHD